MFTSYRFLLFPFFQLSLNQRVCTCGAKVSNLKEQTHHCFQFVIVLNPRAVGVPGQQLEPRLQVANIAQYFYFRNTLLMDYDLSINRSVINRKISKYYNRI